MAKITALFFTTLFLCYMLSHAARPQPAFPQESSPKTQHLGIEEEHVVTEDESCEGVGEEECLMRRTLVAHTDYIYTQKHHP